MPPTDDDPPTIPILALPYPLILFPGGHLSLGLTRPQAHALARLIDHDVPRIAAVPLVPSSPDNPSSQSKLNEYGVLARITHLVRSPSTTRRQSAPYIATLTGLTRIRLPTASQTSISDFSSKELVRLKYEPIQQLEPSSDSIRAFKSSAIKLLEKLANDERTDRRVRDKWNVVAGVIEDAKGERIVVLADLVVGLLRVDYKDRLGMLEMDSDRMLRNLTRLIDKQGNTLAIKPAEFSPSTPVERTATSDEFDTTADPESDPDGLAELRTKIELLGPGTEERKVAVAEWKRLKRIPSASAEWGVVRGYIEWIVSLPWPASHRPLVVEENKQEQNTPAFLAAARAQLDADHYGLDHVKRRLVEYLAVVRLLEAQETKLKIEEARVNTVTVTPPPPPQTADQPPPLVPSPPPPSAPLPSRKRITARGPILLFVGPPGTGKTSLGASIARALNRPFQRIALGGVRDEGEIRGHRRTYVASSPGIIVQALRRAGRPDPVLLLDEVDKIGQGGGAHGDPSAALLEVLDPEQNGGFRDHYMNLPIDLSGVLFVCTANTLDTIPGALRDRCEIVKVSGYTGVEKIEIGRRFLVKRVVERCGLNEKDVVVDEDVVGELVRGYTAEAGVRGLERAVAGVVRYKAVEYAEGKEGYDPKVRIEDLEGILGVPRWDGDEKDRESRCGVVYGLVVTGMGEGEVMPVESIAVPGKGRLKLTGSLGDVIKESGEIALSWVMAHTSKLGLARDPLIERGIDIHLHLPSGAQKKDGPSAGVAIVCAFVSLLTGTTVRADTAMTGEITLLGRVTPVGGIKEKVLGAHRAGVKTLLLPFANKRDVVRDVPEDVRKDLRFVFVKTVEQALAEVFGEGVLRRGGSVGTGAGGDEWRAGEVGSVLSRL